MAQLKPFTRLVLSISTLCCVGFAQAPEFAALRSSAPPDLCRVARDLNDARLISVCGQIRYVGNGTFTGLNLVPSSIDILSAYKAGAEGRDDLVAARHFFTYDLFTFSIKNDNPRSLDMVLRTAAAIDSLRRSNPAAYQFIRATTRYPTTPSMSDTRWKNRFERIFVSFDPTPDFIAAGVTLQGMATPENGVDLTSSYAVVSIDEETIQGNSSQMGSGRIYGKATPGENYRAYMADGIIFTLLHEMTHRYIDYLNSTSRVANAVYRSRANGTGEQIATATDAEEILANETAMAFIGMNLSDAMRSSVRQENTALINKAGVREQLDQLRALGGWRGALVIPD